MINLKTSLKGHSFQPCLSTNAQCVIGIAFRATCACLALQVGMLEATMTTKRLSCVALVAVAFAPSISSSFQPITRQHLLDAFAVDAVHSVPYHSTVKVLLIAGGAPLRAVGNGDNKSTFGVEESLAKASAVVVGTVLTYALHNQLSSMGPVQASGLVSIASTLLLPEKLALAALCGSFAGMATVAVVPTLFSAGILGVVCLECWAAFSIK